MSVQPSEYAPGGVQMISDRPERPDPTPEERQAAKRADEITEEDLLAARKWAPGDLSLALSRYGFPAPSARTKVSRFSYKLTTVRVYSRAAVAEWARGIAALLQV